jgi:hypothetical protein
MKKTIRENTEMIISNYRSKKEKYGNLAHEHSLKSQWNKALEFDTKMRQIDWIIKDLEDLLV